VVQANIANEQMPSSLRRGGNQPKGRGRDVAWNGKVAGLWDLVAKHSDAAIPVHHYSDQKIIKRHFQMIPSWYWLDYGGLALGKEAGQQQCAFRLCACDRRSITNATQRTALDPQRWRIFWTFRDNICTHLTKRRNDALHRTF
jgi:hypothetical protein